MLDTVGLRSIVDSAFQSSQSSSESHHALCLNLKAAHSESLKNGQGSEFQQCFVRCLDRILPTSRKDQCANRVVEFVGSYVKLICPEEVEENEAANDEFEIYVEFVESIIERYVPGFESRLINVRFRCISLVGTLVPLAPLNEDLLAVLERKAIERLRDADSRVRVQAVILVSRFDLSEATTSALATSMQHDPSAEVRLVATYNIAHASKALTELACERVRDLGAQIRRGLYSKVLRTIDFRALSIKARENIVRAGLNDRDEAVKRAATVLVANRWVTMSDNNIELVLQRLDVIGNTDIADAVLKSFFTLRRDVLEQLDFETDFWSELWIEDVVLLRGFQEFCLQEKLGELLYDRMPDLTTLATEIEKLWLKYVDPATYENVESVDEAEDLRECLPFMVEQLLHVASRYDLDDEASRQRITVVIGEIIMAEHAPSNQIIEHILEIQRRLNASDTALVSWAFETLDAMPSSATQASDTDLLTSLLRAISLFNAVLARVSSRDVSAYLPSLYTTYILPALQSPVSEIRAPALKCLGLASLIDSKFALENFQQFAELITQNGEQLLRVFEGNEALVDEIVICISAITDILLVHVDTAFPIAAVSRLWIALLKSEYPAIQNAAALSLAKLVLSSTLEDVSIALSQLVIFYFENTPGIEEDDMRALTQQQLTLFLRAYCLFDEGKQALASIFGIVFEQFAIYKSTQRSSVTIGDLVCQLIELTSYEPNKPREPTSEAIDDPNTWQHAHAQIALELVKLIAVVEDSTMKRSLSSSLSKISLDNAPPIAIQQIHMAMEALGNLNDIKMTAIRNTLMGFETYLAQLESSIPQLQGEIDQVLQLEQPEEPEEPKEPEEPEEPDHSLHQSNEPMMINT